MKTAKRTPRIAFKPAQGPATPPVSHRAIFESATRQGRQFKDFAGMAAALKRKNDVPTA